MTVFVKDSGTFRTASEIYVKDSGTWREADIVYKKDAGTWRIVHPETGGITPTNVIANFDRETNGTTVTGTVGQFGGFGEFGQDSTVDLALANGIKVTCEAIFDQGPFNIGGVDYYLAQVNFTGNSSVASLIGTSSTAFNIRAAGAGFNLTGVAAYNSGGSSSTKQIYNINNFSNSGSGGDRFGLGTNSITFSGGNW